MFVASRGIAILSNLDMQQCPKMFCNFVQKVLAKNTAGEIASYLNNNYNYNFDKKYFSIDNYNIN